MDLQIKSCETKFRPAVKRDTKKAQKDIRFAEKYRSLRRFLKETILDGRRYNLHGTRVSFGNFKSYGEIIAEEWSQIPLTTTGTERMEMKEGKGVMARTEVAVTKEEEMAITASTPAPTGIVKTEEIMSISEDGVTKEDGITVIASAPAPATTEKMEAKQREGAMASSEDAVSKDELTDTASAPATIVKMEMKGTNSEDAVANKDEITVTASVQIVNHSWSAFTVGKWNEVFSIASSLSL